jgi:hypothetical protein
MHGQAICFSSFCSASIRYIFFLPFQARLENMAEVQFTGQPKKDGAHY